MPMETIRKTILTAIVMISSILSSEAQSVFQNPILRGFNPDPSICRVGDDYYMATSSFTWTPGMPVYHSRDLVHWERICYAKPESISLDGLNDNDGIWAVTIRYHDGYFYLIANAQKCGGNFFIKAKDPKGPWSDPVWIEDAPGIDPSLFWDDDGRCYYTGNRWNFKHDWTGQCAIWIQEIDLNSGRLLGEPNDITYGYAANAGYAEGPHIYKMNGKYLLLMAEGGAQSNHAVTAHYSGSLTGKYTPCKVNPVITHRQLGNKASIQCIGHADIVDTPDGEWWMVVLGNRVSGGLMPIGRETFLAKVDFQDGELIVNPGEGRILETMEGPSLANVPMSISDDWYFLRSPGQHFADIDGDRITMRLQPEVIDSLVSPSVLLKKVSEFDFSRTCKITFSTKKDNEEAGMVYYRTANGYFAFMKGKEGISLYCKDKGKKRTIARAPYKEKSVFLKIDVRDNKVRFFYGNTPDASDAICEALSIAPVCDNKYNKFNGTGIGVYASSNGRKSKAVAEFESVDQ